MVRGRINPSQGKGKQKEKERAGERKRKGKGKGNVIDAVILEKCTAHPQLSVCESVCLFKFYIQDQAKNKSRTSSNNPRLFQDETKKNCKHATDFLNAVKFS